MADTGFTSTAQPETTNQESLLLDHLRRFERNRAGMYAVHLHLSQLKPNFRQSHYMRIAGRSFDALMSNFDARLFLLTNTDMILVCRNVKIDDIDVGIYKLRALFAEDPLTLGENGSPDDRFTTWYDLAQPHDYKTLNGLIERMVAENAQRRRRGQPPARPAGMSGQELDPSNLAAINKRLARTRIADLIRQQTALDIRPNGGVLFRENFVSMGDMQQRIAPDVNLFGSTWLFQYLTETLDKRMLAVVQRRNFETLKTPISLNLNISTVLSPEFRNFHAAARGHADKVVIEFQTIDVFAELGQFERARDWLKSHGYKVLIDGLSPMSLQFFDPGLLEPDFIKVNWTAELMDKSMPIARMAELRDVIEYTGPDRVVLARVESEAAVKWAVKLGMHRMQGHFIDKLVEAMSAARGGA